jgi:hypothetical protein
VYHDDALRGNCGRSRKRLPWELWKKSEAFAAEVPVPRIAPLPSLHEFCKKDLILAANEVLCVAVPSGTLKNNFQKQSSRSSYQTMS